MIDETYNGEKYPIIERKYNSYWFPENYNPTMKKPRPRS